MTRVRAVAVILAALVAPGPLGCAHRRPEPVVAPSDKPVAGTVAVSVSPTAPGGVFQRPGTVGAGQGAKKGAAMGAVVPFVPGLVVISDSRGDGRGFLVGLMMLGAGLVLAPVGAGVGAAVGAIAAPSREEVERTAAALDRALAATDLPEALAVWILEAAGERPVVRRGLPESVTADTVLEVDPAIVWLVSKDPTDWRPGLRLRLATLGRLTRASDGEELGRWAWEQEGPEAHFFEWGKTDARLFREELARAGRALAAKIIADVF